MAEFTSFRDYDLTSRRDKIERTFRLEPIKSEDDMPIIVNTPSYFGFGNKNIPSDYWDNPASMLKYQEEGFARHLSAVNDDTVPYFMPWFGTGVLASAFGCPIKPARGVGDDPCVAGASIQSLSDIAKLKYPDFEKAGQMPQVLKFIDYARIHSELPVGLTDMNSPLSTLAQICGYENLFLWMYDEPEAVHYLMNQVTEAFIEWVKLQKKHIGEPLDRSNGLQGVWSPHPVGVWVSDDDLTLISAELYEEFVVPYYSRIFAAFGGGSVHFCGNGSHMAESLLKIENIKVVNNSPLWNIEAFGQLVDGLHGQVVLQLQDIATTEPENYYEQLFGKFQSLNGVMVATFVTDMVGMERGGGSANVNWDSLKVADRIVRAVRSCVRKKLENRV